jgi:Kef-type K+ transport system membrane component KefB
MGMNLQDFLHSSPFYEFTGLLVLASIVGVIAQLLRQPMIVSFIAVGIISGPSALGVVKSKDNIEVLAELGISLLLFLVGLKLDYKLIKNLGLVSLATGLGQVFFTSAIGYGLSLALGFDHITSIYIGVALTFSSTIIIIKLLSDKKEINSLHGKIAVGFLIVQDLVVVLAMMVLSTLSLKQDMETPDGITLLLKGLGLTLALGAIFWAFTRYAATPIMRKVTRSPELIIIFSIGWASLMASVGDHFGFGKELGGAISGNVPGLHPFPGGDRDSSLLVAGFPATLFLYHAGYES